MTALRDQIFEALLAEHHRRAQERIEASPEEHQAAFADAVMAVFQPRLDEQAAEIEQLRYERRLLGFARMVLDRVAFGNRADWFDSERISAEAEDIAQRIVDEIGHPVTDEPALGPSYRQEIERLRAALGGAFFVTIDPSDLARYLDKWEDTLAFAEEYFTKKSEAAAAQHCNPKVFYSPLCQRVSATLAEVRRIKSLATAADQAPETT